MGDLIHSQMYTVVNLLTLILALVCIDTVWVVCSVKPYQIY